MRNFKIALKSGEVKEVRNALHETSGDFIIFFAFEKTGKDLNKMIIFPLQDITAINCEEIRTTE